jgi:hypothetical protein
MCGRQQAVGYVGLSDSGMQFPEVPRGALCLQYPERYCAFIGKRSVASVYISSHIRGANLYVLPQLALCIWTLHEWQVDVLQQRCLLHGELFFLLGICNFFFVAANSRSRQTDLVHENRSVPARYN